MANEGACHGSGPARPTDPRDSIIAELRTDNARLLARVEAAEAERDALCDELTRCHEHGRNLVLQNVAQGKDRDEWKARVEAVRVAVERARTDKAQYSANAYDVLVNLIEELEGI